MRWKFPRIRREFQEKVKQSIDQNQKEYILREQMKVIREELGEDSLSDADEYEKQLQNLKADKEVKEKLQKEIEPVQGNAGGKPGGQRAAYLHRNTSGTALE